MKQPVMVMVLSGGEFHLIEACVLDVSENGAQLRTPAPVPCGSRVKIDSDNAALLGVVCRCDSDDGAYRVGVQLVAPSHLIELELLNAALVKLAQSRPPAETGEREKAPARLPSEP